MATNFVRPTAGTTDAESASARTIGHGSSFLRPRTGYRGARREPLVPNTAASSWALGDDHKMPVSAEVPTNSMVEIDTGRLARDVISFIPIQEWEGCVTKIDGESFSARLLDVTLGETFENDAIELSHSDINPEDIERVKLGAIFRFTVGYQVAPKRPRLRGYQIFFRDIEPISNAALNAAAERGKARAAGLQFK